MYRQEKLEETRRQEGNRLHYMLSRLEELKDEFNSTPHIADHRVVPNSIEMFSKWHDLHFQFEEHWKFAGLTLRNNLNPKMNLKL